MDYQNPNWRAKMRIRLDVNNALQSVIGAHGIDSVAIDRFVPQAQAAITDIAKNSAALRTGQNYQIKISARFWRQPNGCAMPKTS
jgi:uncharacterized protein involved in copper resistance